MQKTILLSIFFLLLTVTGLAQVTLVKGRVTDETTNEPIPFANIIFKNSTIGTISDINGHFELQTSTGASSIEVSFVGYKSQVLNITPFKRNQLSVKLQEDSQVLEAVELVTKKRQKKKKSDSPAVQIMKQVWKHKKENISENIEVLSYDRHEKTQLDLNNFKESLSNGDKLGSFSFIFDYADTSSLNGKTSLPMLINESMYRVLHTSNPKFDQKITLASQVSGFRDNHSANALLQSADFEFDIYDRSITIFEKAFASPLSTVGFLNYHYYLQDTITVEGGRKQFHIQYIPKRAHELSFIGDIWVDEAHWAVEKIRLRVVKDANLNFVSDLEVVQEFTFNEELQKWLIRKDKLTADISVLNMKEEIGFFGHRTYIFDNYRFDKYWDDNTIDSLVEIGFKDDDFQLKFIQENRLETLTQQESNIYTMIDSLQKLPAFKLIDNLSYVAASGYIPFKNKFEIGPIWNFYSNNEIEGHRFYFGGSTAFRANKNRRLAAFLAYGTKDKTFKFGTEYKHLVNKKLYHALGASIKYDYENLTQIGSSKLNSGSIFSSILSSSEELSLSEVFSIEANSEKDLNRHFKIDTRMTYTRYGELGNLRFDFLDDVSGKRIIKTSDFTFGIIYDFAPTYLRERSVYRDQIFTKNKYRAQLYATMGFNKVFGSQYGYQRYRFQFNARNTLGALGRLFYEINTEKIVGDLPYILLYAPPVNNTQLSSAKRFSLLKDYEFMADTYISFFAEHHLEGLIFNHIPLIKKLNFREVVTFKGLYGSLTDENAKNTINNQPIVAPDETGYFEAGIGVENILKIIRVDYVFRLNHRLEDTKDNQGFRFTMSLRI